VHRAGGVLLQHAKEQALHCDVRPGDRVAYFTTTGWMMWNWLVSMLARGATVVLYDGSPMHPGAGRLLELAAAERLSLLGVSAKWVDGARKAGAGASGGAAGLGALRTVCSTGSPLSPEGFAWVYERVKADVHLASISGGTDLCGCFVGGDPTAEVRAGEIQGPMLGMDVDVWTTAVGRSRESRTARASSCVAGRSRRCRSASGGTAATGCPRRRARGRGTSRRTTRASPGRGRTATSPRGRRRAAW
jgi:acetoacetyl-CoA synthetase